jgi:L-amino acid N-acyltransferase YncA
MTDHIIVRELCKEDYPLVKLIYEQGIATKNATFETTAPDWEEWNKKYIENCRFVAVSNGKVVGWAALSAVSGRCVYAGVCEVSVYIHEDHKGKGIGKKMLNALITASEQNSIWTLQSGIFPENAVSIKLHLDLGFREVGRREKIGKMDGIWRDTVLLERRSGVIGTN